MRHDLALPGTYSFSDLIESGVLFISDGYRAKNEELGGDGPIFLRAGHVSDSFIDFNGVERFHSDLTSKVLHKMSAAGDVIVTTKGNSTGRVSYVTEIMPPFVYSPHLSFWRSLKPEVLAPKFLRYWSSSFAFQGQLASFANSTDMAPYLSLADQRRLRIFLPTPTEQCVIGETLAVFDEKIELNRLMKKTLESMVRALFKSWFIDFDPVSRGIPFPVRFTHSAVGRIPEGWAINSLGEHISVARGLSYKGAGLSDEEGVPLHNLNSIYEGGGYKREGIKFYQGEFRERHIAEPGDILVANTEQGHDRLLIGCPAIVPSLFGSGIFSHHLYRVRPREGSPLGPLFLYCLLLESSFRDKVVAYASGTTVNMLPLEALEKPRLVVPDVAAVDRFESIVSPMFSKLEIVDLESDSLASLRDALVPEFFARVAGHRAIG